MTGGTRALIGGPFVFPHMALYLMRHAHTQASQVQQPTPFYGPQNFPRAASQHLITCAQPVRKGCERFIFKDGTIFFNMPHLLKFFCRSLFIYRSLPADEKTLWEYNSKLISLL